MSLLPQEILLPCWQQEQTAVLKEVPRARKFLEVKIKVSLRVGQKVGTEIENNNQTKSSLRMGNKQRT